MVDMEHSDGGGPIDCRHCGTKMHLQRIKKYPGSWPYVIGGLGLFFTLFMIGAVIGIPMLLIGIYMGMAQSTIRLCPECGYYYEVYKPD